MEPLPGPCVKFNIFSGMYFHSDSCNCIEKSPILKTFTSSWLLDFCVFSNDVAFQWH